MICSSSHATDWWTSWLSDSNVTCNAFSTVAMKQWVWMISRWYFNAGLYTTPDCRRLNGWITINNYSTRMTLSRAHTSATVPFIWIKITASIISAAYLWLLQVSIHIFLTDSLLKNASSSDENIIKSAKSTDTPDIFLLRLMYYSQWNSWKWQKTTMWQSQSQICKNIDFSCLILNSMATLGW